MWETLKTLRNEQDLTEYYKIVNRRARKNGIDGTSNVQNKKRNGDNEQNQFSNGMVQDYGECRSTLLLRTLHVYSRLSATFGKSKRVNATPEQQNPQVICNQGNLTNQRFQENMS